MILSNLVEKRVSFFMGTAGKHEGHIVAIYQHEDKLLAVVQMDVSGMLTTQTMESLTINVDDHYAVDIYWSPEQKIRAIKTVREITGLGLKEAKEMVEMANPVRVAKRLTMQEAQINILLTLTLWKV